MRSFLRFLFFLYRKIKGPMLGQTCRFYPSCSQYAEEAIERFGLIFGGFLAFKRLISCHPFSPGGYDPVPVDNIFFSVIRPKSDVSRETL